MLAIMVKIAITLTRAVLGIEPRTSRTLSENHATRPNSHARLSRDCKMQGIWDYLAMR